MIEYEANYRTQVVANAYYLSVKYLRAIESELFLKYTGDLDKWNETFDRMAPSIQIIAAIRLVPILKNYKEEIYALMRDDSIELFDIVYDLFEARLADLENLVLFDDGLSFYDDIPKITFDSDRERDLVTLTWALWFIRFRILSNPNGPIIYGMRPVFVKEYADKIDFNNSWFVSQEEDDKLSICIDSIWCVVSILLDKTISTLRKYIINKNSLDLFTYSMGLSFHPAITGEESKEEFFDRIGLGVSRPIDDEKLSN